MRRMQELYREVQGRRGKGRLLRQVSETLDCHPKHAGRLLRGRTPKQERPFRIRDPIYPERIIRVLESIWEATQHAWSVRLQALLPLWMPRIRQRWELSPEDVRLLLRMSPATMDRRLGPYKRKLSRKIYGQTKPGRWLRQSIPIQTESWEVPEPGWMEVDTVSHSGPSAQGLFGYTLDEVDLFSGWVELYAILGKSAEAVIEAAERIRQALPFDTAGMDSDNGEEFINYDMDRYCRGQRIKRFRSRPNKKDDQAHIEQKNGTHVRRLIGWDRYDTPAAIAAMNDLYRNEWRLLTNLFLPSVKLANKVRVGSKIKRVYGDAKTPLDRLLESGKGDRDKLEELRRLRARLDPFELSKTVDRKLEVIWKLASRGKSVVSSTQWATRPRWEDLTLSEDYPQLLFQANEVCLKQVRKSYWRDNFFGTD